MIEMVISSKREGEETLDATVFKRIIDGIGDIVTEAELRIDRSGIRAVVMDAARSVLVNLFIPAGDFELFRADRETEVGILVKNLASTVKMAASDSKIKISYDENIRSEMHIDVNIDDITCHRILKPLDLDRDKFEVQDLPSQGEVQITTASFLRFFKSFVPNSPTLEVEVDHSGINAKTHGEGMEGISKISRSSAGVEFRCDVPSVRKISMKYFNSFTKVVTPEHGKVKVSLGNSSPLVLEYSFSTYGKIAYYIAPIIDEE